MEFFRFQDLKWIVKLLLIPVVPLWFACEWSPFNGKDQASVNLPVAKEETIPIHYVVGKELPYSMGTYSGIYWEDTTLTPGQVVSFSGYLPKELWNCEKRFIKITLKDSLIYENDFFYGGSIPENIFESSECNEGAYVKVKCIIDQANYEHGRFRGYKLRDLLDIQKIPLAADTIYRECVRVLHSNAERLAREVPQHVPERWDPNPPELNPEQFMLKKLCWPKKLYFLLHHESYEDIMVDFENRRAICRFKGPRWGGYLGIVFTYINIVYGINEKRPLEIIVDYGLAYFE